MPNTREKLIELLLGRKEAVSEICENSSCKTCQYEKYGFNCDKAILADHLIANGVTVQEWISVKDRLPDGRYDVLVSRTWWNERKSPIIGWYNEVAKTWYIITEDGYMVNDKVTHWMHLPEAPKGE